MKTQFCIIDESNFEENQDEERQRADEESATIESKAVQTDHRCPRESENILVAEYAITHYDCTIIILQAVMIQLQTDNAKDRIPLWISRKRLRRSLMK